MSERPKCFMVFPSNVAPAVREACAEGATKAGYDVHDWRAAETYEGGKSILDGVREGIATASWIVAIMNDRDDRLNANVVYEIGYAHAAHGSAQVTTVASLRAVKKLPFDLQGWRHVSYADDGPAEMARVLEEIGGITAVGVDLDALRRLDVKVRALCESAKDRLKSAPWQGDFLRAFEEPGDGGADAPAAVVERRRRALRRARALISFGHTPTTSGFVAAFATLAGFSIFGFAPVTQAPVILAAFFAFVAGAVRFSWIGASTYFAVIGLCVLLARADFPLAESLRAEIGRSPREIAAVGMALIGGLCMLALRPARSIWLSKDLPRAVGNWTFAVGVGWATNDMLRPAFTAGATGTASAPTKAAFSAPFAELVPLQCRGYVAILIGCTVAKLFYRTPWPVMFADVVGGVRRKFARKRTRG